MKKFLLSILTFIIPFITFAQEAAEKGVDQRIDEAFKPISDAISKVVFFEVYEGAPFVIVLLVLSLFRFGSPVWSGLQHGFGCHLKSLFDFVATWIDGSSPSQNPKKTTAANRVERQSQIQRRRRDQFCPRRACRRR